MENTILKDRKKIESIQNLGSKRSIYVVESGEKYRACQLGIIEIQCTRCGVLKKIKFGSRLCKKPYICIRCHSTYNNGFKGKQHTEECKKRLSIKKTGIRSNPHSKSVYQYWVEKYGKEKADIKFIEYRENHRIASLGDKNGFFGKKHTNVSKKKQLESYRITLRNMPEEKKKQWRQNVSIGHKNLLKERPEYYKELKSRGGKATALLGNRYKINNIEKIVQLKLKELGIKMKYSVILGFKQYDFGSKKYRILLEVNGDYWHGNPNKYSFEKLNDIQKSNIKKDALKSEFAEKHGLKLFTIWEADILSGNFTVLEKIKKDIDEIQLNSDTKDRIPIS